MAASRRAAQPAVDNATQHSWTSRATRRSWWRAPPSECAWIITVRCQPATSGDTMGPMTAPSLSSRRTFCAEAAGGLALLTLPSMTPAQSQADGIGGSQREAPSRIASAFMTNCAVPGLSVAIARHVKIIYEQAFGYADLKKKASSGESVGNLKAQRWG